MSFFNTKADSFEDAVKPFERQIYYTCLGMMGNPDDAQDCAQEAILKAYKNFSTFRGAAKFGTWLHTIAARCCLDALHKKNDVLSLETLREEGWEPTDNAPSLYVQFEEEERRQLLRKAIQKLTVEQKQVIVLCDLQGFSYIQTAEILNCPIGTVRSRLNRARISLKNILKNTELFSTEDGLIDERRETV